MGAPSKAVSELLIHPANFAEDEAPEMSPDDEEKMKKEHFSDMMHSIQSIYMKINEKLKLWLRYKFDITSIFEIYDT